MHDSVTKSISNRQVGALLEDFCEHLWSAILGNQVRESCISKCIEPLVNGQDLLIHHHVKQDLQASSFLLRMGEKCDVAQKDFSLALIISLHYSDCCYSIFN